MNILTESFPTKIKIDEEIYDINYDFKNCLRIIEAYEDEDLTIQEKHYVMIKRLYKTIPQNIEQAIIKGIKFLNCGEESTKNTNNLPRIYSFEKDAKYIYSAMNQTHHIDMSIENIHWWKFSFLFLDIGKETTFTNILNLRQKKFRGKLSKEEKKMFADSREILDLNYQKEDSEEVSEFMKLFNGGDETRNQNQE